MHHRFSPLRSPLNTSSTVVVKVFIYAPLTLGSSTLPLT